MIVITAPTGQIGHQVLDNVLNSDEPIRVIVREPSTTSTLARVCAERRDASRAITRSDSPLSRR